MQRTTPHKVGFVNLALRASPNLLLGVMSFCFVHFTRDNEEEEFY